MNLTPGIALTKEQIDRLTSDIVWLEEKQVQGQAAAGREGVVNIPPTADAKPEKGSMLLPSLPTHQPQSHV